MADALPSTCTLHQEDCLKIMATLQPASIALVFADLPYASKMRRFTRNAWDHAFDIEKFWIQEKAIRKKNAVTILTASGIFVADLIYSNVKEYKYDIIWQKGRPSGFINARLMPLRSHENILIFYSAPPIYNPIMQSGGRRHGPQFSGKSINCHKTNGYMKSNETGTNYPRSIVSLPCVNNRISIHPTQKPVALLEWLIKTYTNPGDTVLDPVFGSCTTGVACARLGRNFIGIEKDPKYFRVGRDRVNAERADLGLPPAISGGR